MEARRASAGCFHHSSNPKLECSVHVQNLPLRISRSSRKLLAVSPRWTSVRWSQPNSSKQTGVATAPPTAHRSPVARAIPSPAAACGPWSAAATVSTPAPPRWRRGRGRTARRSRSRRIRVALSGESPGRSANSGSDADAQRIGGERVEPKPPANREQRDGGQSRCNRLA